MLELYSISVKKWEARKERFDLGINNRGGASLLIDRSQATWALRALLVAWSTRTHEFASESGLLDLGIDPSCGWSSWISAICMYSCGHDHNDGVHMHLTAFIIVPLTRRDPMDSLSLSPLATWFVCLFARSGIDSVLLFSFSIPFQNKVIPWIFCFVSSTRYAITGPEESLCVWLSERVGGQVKCSLIN